MKRIGLFTINDYNNYGNRLQNYAAQEVLKSLGFEVNTIVNTTSPLVNIKEEDGFLYKFKNLRKLTFKEFKSKIINFINREEIQKNHSKRIASFKEFTINHICETDFCISENNVPNDLADSYDYFVVGSDQIWNPVFRKGSSIDFLTFAPSEKRVAFSPSFGISKIPLEYANLYKKWLSEMAHLSVREDAGAKIIKELTDRDAEVLIDPTLMLSKEQWLKVSKAANNKPARKYMLTYFLGGIPRDYKEKINEIAEQNNLDIINLADIKEKEIYVTGPSEFIDFINSASLFCTDSYHGVIFSILMETPFVVFNRIENLPSMNSRLETLLRTFKLESRLIKNIENQEQIFKLDYSHVDMILHNERKKVFRYLNSAFGLNK